LHPPAPGPLQGFGILHRSQPAGRARHHAHVALRTIGGRGGPAGLSPRRGG